jgi:SAM-dependent methyltransferase
VYLRPELRSLPVELHWRLYEGYQPYAFDLAEVWANRRPIAGAPDGVCTMSFEHELAHLCLHLDRHAVMLRSLVTRPDWLELLLLPHGLARMVWLYDIAELIRRRTAMIDWDRFVQAARVCAFAGRLHAVLELCGRALGIGPPAEVMRALDVGRPRFAERLAQRVVLASHRANGHADARRFRWAKALSGDVLRLTHTWTSLFPPAAYLRSTYPGDHSTASRRIRHFREVVPRLAAEIQGRWRSFRGPHGRGNNAQAYDQAFYDAFSENSAQSAALLLGVLYRVYRPRSVVDVGCGTGAWLAAAETLGSTRLKGLDGQWVPKERLMSRHIEFEAVDLARPLRIDGQYDLCICVEVAEHVPATRAHTLVRALCGAADVVVFGAAIAHQGGRGHVNEQWQSYWVSLFKDNRYECFDIFRGSLWNNDSVAWWYRQNTLLFVRATTTVIDREVLRTLERPIPDIVHPRSYELKVQRVQAQPQASAPSGLRSIWGHIRACWGRFAGS